MVRQESKWYHRHKHVGTVQPFGTLTDSVLLYLQDAVWFTIAKVLLIVTPIDRIQRRSRRWTNNILRVLTPDFDLNHHKLQESVNVLTIVLRHELDQSIVAL